MLVVADTLRSNIRTNSVAIIIGFFESKYSFLLFFLYCKILRELKRLMEDFYIFYSSSDVKD